MVSPASDDTATTPQPASASPVQGRLARFLASDLWYSFRRKPSAISAALLLIFLIVTAFAAPVIAPQDTYDPTQLNLLNSELPPIWEDGAQMPFLLGTDTQGRDILSAILYGSRVSILIGIASVILSLTVGMSLGLIAGYFGGIIDNILMRFGDVLLSIPTILVAILVSAVAMQALAPEYREIGAGVVLVLAISMSAWVQYARIVRAQTIVERRKEYVQAAQLLKVSAGRIMMNHIRPNTLTPVMVAATLNFGLAILTEATLSFLGIGMPPSQPSLGTLIRFGNQFLFSGIWWAVVFPVVQLCLLVVSVNVLGDWLRDALNPKLR